MNPVTEDPAAPYVVIERDQLPDSELEGYLFGGAKVCLIFIDLAPGGGPRLHRHPYEEIFIILEGQATFAIDSDTGRGQSRTTADRQNRALPTGSSTQGTARFAR